MFQELENILLLFQYNSITLSIAQLLYQSLKYKLLHF